MNVRRSALGYEVEAPAKLNLLLDVLAKRGDGFHEVETLITPIALCDRLSIEPAEKGRLELLVRQGSATADAEALPTGDENLALRALRRLGQRAGETRGARLTLVKRIPMAAGLAGGSSDAAAALLLGNALWGLGWSRDRLSEIAAELGSDVPFFLSRGAAICRGRGERIEPVAALGNLRFVVVKPPAGLSTAEVYRHCRPSDSPQSHSPQSAAALATALVEGRLTRARRLFHNQLQPAAERLSPWIDRLRSEFDRSGCLVHQMSGSGTSYFGLCHHARHASSIAARLRARGLGQVFAVGCAF